MEPIRIHKDGAWYYQGAEMIRKDIVMLFSRNLRREAGGKYLIEMGGERCYVEVEDTPFVVRSVSLMQGEGNDYFSIRLTDDSTEKLDLTSLRISPDNILYCAVKDGTFAARFSRPAYYQFAATMEHDSRTDGYFVALNGQTHYIRALDAPR